tara:strand:+ start:932 stop:1045 length:114 start_codon:yes stop_codon:yes gene_type:complete
MTKGIELLSKLFLEIIKIRIIENSKHLDNNNLYFEKK